MQEIEIKGASLDQVLYALKYTLNGPRQLRWLYRRASGAGPAYGTALQEHASCLRDQVTSAA